MHPSENGASPRPYSDHGGPGDDRRERQSHHEHDASETPDHCKRSRKTPMRAVLRERGDVRDEVVEKHTERRESDRPAHIRDEHEHAHGRAEFHGGGAPRHGLCRVSGKKFLPHFNTEPGIFISFEYGQILIVVKYCTEVKNRAMVKNRIVEDIMQRMPEITQVNL